MGEMLGTTPGELIGRPLLDFVFADDLSDALARIARRAQGESERSETRLRREDGGELAVRTHAVSLRTVDGAFEGGLVLVSDLTEVKRTEEHLQHVAKMEAIGALAGGIAHDFNNLLSVILSYAAILDEEPLDEPTRDAIHEIRRAGERAAAVTRQLLAFSRKQRLTPSVVDMNEVVADVRPLLARLVGEHIELALVSSDAPAKVHVDRGQLEQVLVNLAVNARDAMPDGGRLTIETTISSHATNGGCVCVAVTDTGLGMAATTQRRLFEPFFTTKEKGKGTGLGLASVYGIVQQSGGQIRVKSELGEGTRFEVLLPESARALDAAPVARDAAPALRGTETILLVEDDAQVRSAAALVLRKSGYDVLEANNAGEALLICEETNVRVDLLLTDVVMPRMTGPQLVERLHRARADVPVLYMSGYADSALVKACGEDVLAKPLVPSVLLRSMRSMLDD